MLAQSEAQPNRPRRPLPDGGFDSLRIGFPELGGFDPRNSGLTFRPGAKIKSFPLIPPSVL